MPVAPKRFSLGKPKARADGDKWRGSSRERGYDKDWEKLAAHVRRRDNYLCQPCLKRDIEKPIGWKSKDGTFYEGLVDHIIPVAVRPDLRLDETNCQAICLSCHKRKTDEDRSKYG